MHSLNLVLHLTTVFAMLALVGAARPTTRPVPPVGSMENPKAVTSADIGPDIDPVKRVAGKFDSLPLFATFRSFVSGSYALADVWIYAENDDQELYDAQISYVFPKFYKPTWGEIFDHVARQMRCRWEWNPKNRQFRFFRSDREPFFGVKLADGWQRQDRGMYVWHAPSDQQFGMDIYYFGHFTETVDAPELLKKVREHFALDLLKQWPDPPGLDAMTSTKVGDADALCLEYDTPRPGGFWRQWSFVQDGHAFLIVSAMPKERVETMKPAVDAMLKTFKLSLPKQSGKPVGAAKSAP